MISAASVLKRRDTDQFSVRGEARLEARRILRQALLLAQDFDELVHDGHFVAGQAGQAKRGKLDIGVGLHAQPVDLGTGALRGAVLEEVVHIDPECGGDPSTVRNEGDLAFPERSWLK